MHVTDRYAEQVRRLRRASLAVARSDAPGTAHDEYWDAVLCAGVEREYLVRLGWTERVLDVLEDRERRGLS